jgi:hypothetical protein
MEDRGELEQIVFGQTRVILNRDLSVMNPNLVAGSQGLVVGKRFEQGTAWPFGREPSYGLKSKPTANRHATRPGVNRLFPV